MNNERLLEERKILQEEQRAIDPSQFPLSFIDIHYADQSPDQLLDVYLPDTKGEWPLVVFVHGGGWYFGGRKEECISSVFKVISQGYAVATVDYRLVPDAFFPGQIQDVKAAIRYLRAHGSELHVKTDKIVIWGNSAGGHLAALAGVREGDPMIEDLSQGNAEYSSKVDGVISWYGVYDFAKVDEYKTELGLGGVGAAGPEAAMLDGHVREASPINYVNSDYPPILVQQGKADHLVPWLQAEAFASKIREVCGEDRVTLEYFENADHGDPQIKCDANIQRCIEFLDSILYEDQPCTFPRGEMPELRFAASSCSRVDPYEKA